MEANSEVLKTNARDWSQPLCPRDQRAIEALQQYVKDGTIPLDYYLEETSGSFRTDETFPQHFDRILKERNHATA